MPDITDFPKMLPRTSVWRVSRPISTVFFTLTFYWFMVAFTLDFPWQIGWGLLFATMVSELLQSLHDARRRYYVFDAPLFCLGMLVFTGADPMISALAGLDFPGVGNSVYRGNEIGNLSGIIISLFCMCFFIGRLFIASPKQQVFQVTDSDKPLEITSLKILIMATTISMLAYFMNGGGLSINNLIYSITARTTGYVAFSSSGLGTANPIIALFAQCIPTTIILWVLSIDLSHKIWSVFAVLGSSILLGLYVLIGGRSGVIFVVISIVLFIVLRRQLPINLTKVMLICALSLVLLTVQSNYRDRGYIGSGFLEHSPLRGFALNREVAFIADTYGRRLDFMHGPNLIPRIILPIPETAILFITNPIPRKIWGTKPIDPSFGPYNMERTGKTGFGASSNITPTIPGRFYINYGFWGVLQIGLVFGMMWRFFEVRALRSRFVTSNKILLSSLLGAIMFISLRDFTFGKFYPFFFMLFFVYLSNTSIKKCALKLLSASFGRCG